MRLSLEVHVTIDPCPERLPELESLVRPFKFRVADGEGQVLVSHGEHFLEVRDRTRVLIAALGLAGFHVRTARTAEWDRPVS